jgi:predicted dehydrogenase
MSLPITALLFGAGQRGAEVYGPYALQHPGELQFTAVAEPDPLRRRKFADDHGIPEERQYKTWRDALNQPKLADVVFNCTQDHMHYASGIAAMDAGYDMMLEKPIASRLKDTVGLVQAAEEYGRLMQVCHVLRYTDFFQKVQQIVRFGGLGQLINISHRENVSSWHMAHSFVRGNWRSESDSSPMILAKCCHDLDLIQWIAGSRVTKLSSFGSQLHFKAENAPPGAPKRCTDGCPVEKICPFYAPSLYIDLQPIKTALGYARDPIIRSAGLLAQKSPSLMDALANILPPLRELSEYSGWPRSTISDEPGNEEMLLRALKTGPYGRCVYYCDNDVLDHQVVNMNFANDVTATLTMHGHSHEEGRTLRIDGSQATLLGKFSFNQSYLEIRDHRGEAFKQINFPNQVESGGHGGGDHILVRCFIDAIRGDKPTLTDARTSLESHMMAFAAEKSRHEGIMIEMEVFRQQAEHGEHVYPKPPESTS